VTPFYGSDFTVGMWMCNAEKRNISKKSFGHNPYHYLSAVDFFNVVGGEGAVEVAGVVVAQTPSLYIRREAGPPLATLLNPCITNIFSCRTRKSERSLPTCALRRMWTQSTPSAGPWRAVAMLTAHTAAEVTGGQTRPVAKPGCLIRKH